MLFRPTALVFDIGAATGDTAKGYLERRASLVVAVEADLFQFRELFDSTSDEDRIVPIQAAAWHEYTLVDIYHAQDHNERSTARKDLQQPMYTDTEFLSPVPVPSITLDLLVQRFGVPQYVKIDVEGAELEVLKGMSCKPDVLTFEFHGPTMFQTTGCFEILKRLGFTLATWVPAHAEHDTEPDRPIDEVQEELERTLPGWGNITLR